MGVIQHERFNLRDNREQINLRFTHLNVQGLASKRLNKLHSDFFVNLFENNDILLFTETWASEMTELDFKDFEYIPLHRTEIHRSARRDSGGLIIYIRSCYFKGVEQLCKDADDIIVLRFDKDFFGFDSDLFLMYCYVLPDNSARICLQETHTFERICDHIIN